MTQNKFIYCRYYKGEKECPENFKGNKTHFSGNKDPLFTSLHDDPYMKWPDRRICHDCLNKLPLQGSECDVFENVVDVNNAINTGKCEFYIKKKQ